MNTMLRCALAATLVAAMALPAAAQPVQRPFPQNALRGEIAFGQPPLITLNGVAARLAPGARIRGQNNMGQLSGELIGAKLIVNYTVELGGLVHDVWILTSDEAAKKPWPSNADEAQRWSFDPAAQVWTKR